MDQSFDRITQTQVSGSIILVWRPRRFEAATQLSFRRRRDRWALTFSTAWGEKKPPLCKSKKEGNEQFCSTHTHETKLLACPPVIVLVWSLKFLMPFATALGLRKIKIWFWPLNGTPFFLEEDDAGPVCMQDWTLVLQNFQVIQLCTSLLCIWQKSIGFIFFFNIFGDLHLFATYLNLNFWRLNDQKRPFFWGCVSSTNSSLPSAFVLKCPVPGRNLNEQLNPAGSWTIQKKTWMYFYRRVGIPASGASKWRWSAGYFMAFKGFLPPPGLFATNQAFILGSTLTLLVVRGYVKNMLQWI